MGQSVVVHFAEGHVVGGSTSDFHAKRESFHLETSDGRMLTIPIARLKAVFFVHGTKGDPGRRDTPGFGVGYGRRTTVVFRDGEVLEGLTENYSADTAGFMLVPGDPHGNNKRVFCLAAAVANVIIT